MLQCMGHWAQKEKIYVSIHLFASSQHMVKLDSKSNHLYDPKNPYHPIIVNTEELKYIPVSHGNTSFGGKQSLSKLFDSLI